MALCIGEKLKQFRKARDLTQEQLADIFNVSPQSVSRWETGATYPDMELLPHIAIFFEVTVDELLGTKEVLSKGKVEGYTKDIRNLLNAGKFYDAIDLAQKAVDEYPLATHNLHYLLLQALCTACSSDTPGWEENTAKYKDEIITVGERVMRTNPSNWGVKQQLIRQYAKWGMKTEAEKILHTLPAEIWDSQEPWLGLTLDGDEWRKNQLLRIIRAYYLLEYFIQGYVNRADLLEPMKKNECLNAEMQIKHLVDTIICNDAINHLEQAFDYIAIAQWYCEIGDTENALDYVEKATQDSMHHTNHMDITNEDGSNYMPWSTSRNLPWVLWEDHLMLPQFDIVRGEERFIVCFDSLKANSREVTH